MIALSYSALLFGKGIVGVCVGGGVRNGIWIASVLFASNL